MNFALFLFTTNTELASEAVAAGTSGIIIDWERRGKAERQAGADTQINYDTEEDLRRIRNAIKGQVLVRINGFSEFTRAEVDAAIQGGADEILLPMVRTAEEVQRTLDWVAGRCGMGILIETPEAVVAARELGRLPLRRVYVGLNDLAIARQSASLFDAMADGTVDGIRPCFPMPFGLAGLTLPERGAPVPCRLIMGELARLQCSFSFLRRSFWADIRGRDIHREIPRILAGIAEACGRSQQTATHEHSEFVSAVAHLRSPAGKAVGRGGPGVRLGAEVVLAD